MGGRNAPKYAISSVFGKYARSEAVSAVIVMVFGI
jgi:hypothetical protein